MGDTEPSSADEIRLRHAQDHVAFQLDSIDAAQARASVLIAGLALTAGLLAPALPSRSHWLEHALFWVGLSSLVCCSTLLAFVILPRRYRASTTGGVLPSPSSAADLVRSHLATLTTDYIPHNDRLREHVWAALAPAIVLFAVNAGTWGALVLWKEL